MEKEVKKITQKELNELEIKENGFLNPFSKGVTYADVLANLPKDAVLSKYYKDKLTEEEIIWLETELNHYNTNKK
jgi:hypothetical protein